jgi:CheY-like chemotaxis protein/HAMP domain-containing protein
MQWLRDVPMGRKLLMILLIELVLTSIPLGISVSNFRDLDQRLEFIVSVRTEAVKQAGRLHRNLYELRTQEKEAVLTENGDGRRLVLSRIALLRDEVRERFRALTDARLGAESTDRVRTIQSAWAEYDQVLDRVVDLTEAGKHDEAHALSLAHGRTLGEAAATAVLRFTEEQDAGLAAEMSDADAAFNQMLTMLLVLVALSLVVGAALAVFLSRGVTSGITGVVQATDRIASGDLTVTIAHGGQDEVGQLATAVSRMQDALRVARAAARDLDWLKSGIARLNTVVLGQADLHKLADTVLTEVAHTLDAKVGALFVMGEADGAPRLTLLATHAYTVRKQLATHFGLGEGLVGQSALEKKTILLQSAPEDYVRVVSGLGEAAPRNLCVTPIKFRDEIRGVIELGTMAPMSELTTEYLEQAMVVVAAAFEIVRAQAVVRVQQEELRANNEELQAQARALEKSQEELRAQQTELQNANVELETQMLRVKESEERLRTQQEELEVTNEELKDKNDLLEQQKVEMEDARAALTVQADELALASKYKSEFLANMSHELRTPLNSLLLLARSLRDNGEGNLSEEQVESARVIFESGGDLLNLINEILDLSKIEAGRMEVRLENVALTELTHAMNSQFAHMARNQSLSFEVVAAPAAPPQISTDPQRLGQIMKNLVGNALKFTETGGVTVTFDRPAASTDLSRSGLRPDRTLAVHVKDTGIGIPLDKQKVIFEAFQQADSGDRRRYGGTGLGLSISRELVRLLGGEIQLVSTPGEGSVFTAYLPIDGPSAGAPPVASAAPARPAPLPPAVVAAAKTPTTGAWARPNLPPSGAPAPVAPRPKRPTQSLPPAQVDDDRETLQEDDHAILVVEDDARFARILAGHVKKRGFKVLVALTGEEGLELARAWRPSGVVLDLQLPNMDGWAVLNALKQDVDTRHIPVHIVSAQDPSPEGLRIGAIGHASKPLQPEHIEGLLARIEAASAQAEKLVLVVEDDPVMRRETVRIIGNGNVKTVEVDTGAAALQALRDRNFALIVLDLGLPDMPGLDLLQRATAEKITLPPVIIYTVRELTQAEEATLRHYADSIILKDVRSQERLIDEVALFLHRVVRDLPEEKRRTIRRLHETDEPLRGRKVLVVEDDMRTMFAMARLLTEHGLNPVKAENGERALELLAAHPDVDIVLMDMMMPVLDGYEACRRIRAQSKYAQLPVIALTAKAMKEDRDKCIQAGASDYLSKPVDPPRLLSLMRVWLGR